MSTDFDLQQFKRWYVDVLAALFPDRNAGFAILMVSFPLLERYLRNKVELNHNDTLNDRYMNELRQNFPVLSNTECAWAFWKIFRNGILHQVTLSRVSGKRQTALPEGCLTHDIASAIEVDSKGQFLVHPVLFAQRVMHMIESDFATYTSARTTRLPKVDFYQSCGGIVLSTRTD